MSNLKFLYKKNDLPTNKSFGIVFFIFFIIVTIYFFIKNNEINFIILSLAIIFYILGMLNSKILTPLNILWINFGIYLGLIIAPVIMGLIYFFVVTPTALILRIFKKDVLNLKKDDKTSYWIIKSQNHSKMKNQF